MAETTVFLPLGLIIEILLKLPVKTLLRFRCVCKSWLSLISNKKIAISHFELAATRRLIFINRYAPNFLSIDIDASLHDDSAYALLRLGFVRPIYQIKGSCRGFLLLYSGLYFYIWNPSTRLVKQIPEYPLRKASSLNFLFGFADIVLLGFAYDNSTDDYFILSWIFKGYPFEGYQISSSTEFLIFSLRANKWKSIEVAFHLPYMVTVKGENGTRGRLFLNDSIHWVVYNTEISKYVIVSLDLKEMKISEIAWPDDSDIEFDLLVVGGLISAWMRDMNKVKIWEMQKYAVQSSWTKIIEFSIDPALHDSSFIVCVTNFGDIIGKDGEGRLVKFNDRGEFLECPFFHDHYSKSSELVAYTESLFSLPDTSHV